MESHVDTEGSLGVRPQSSTVDLHQVKNDTVMSSVQGRAMDSSFVKALAWTGGTKWAVQVVSWASMVVLAHLLTPADYGIVGMAGVYQLLVSYIAEFGIGTAIITAPSLSQARLAQINAIAVALGTAAMLTSWLAAKPLAWFFHAREIAPLLIISSVTMVTESARSVPQAWLSKRLEFRFLAVAEAAKAFVFLGIALAFALAGYRYWSLVAANIVTSLLMTAVVLQRARIAYQRPSWSCIRDLVLVGRNIMLANLAWYGYSNADFFTAGRLLGPAALGAYTNAWTIATAPIEKIAAVANRVTPSFFAALNDDSSLRRYILRITEVLALLLFPAICGISLVASDFVHLVFGAKWEGMIAPLRLLAVYAGLSCLSTLLPPVMNAKGHSHFNRNVAILAFCILPAAFLLGGKLHGTVGIAAVWVTLYPMFALWSYVKTFRLINLQPREYFRSITPAVSGTVWMAGAVCLLKFILPPQVPLPLRFAALVGSGAVSYFSAIYLLHGPRVKCVAELVRTRLHSAES